MSANVSSVSDALTKTKNGMQKGLTPGLPNRKINDCTVHGDAAAFEEVGWR